MAMADSMWSASAWSLILRIGRYLSVEAETHQGEFGSAVYLRFTTALAFIPLGIGFYRVVNVSTSKAEALHVIVHLLE
jgi:hypothetical protein